MTMQMVGPYLTTTRYSNKKKKPNAKQLKAQAEHDKWLRKNGVHPDQLAAKKHKDVSINSIPNYREGARGLPTSDKICGHGPAKESMTYSGERQLLGIATMHKSNMVPIFADKKDDAKDIASMRR
jgi:hypothetical protein